MGVDPLYKAWSTSLDNRNIPFVKGEDATHIKAGCKHSTADHRRAQTEILRHARIDADRRLIVAATGVLRNQLHVHERRFTRFVELLLGVHRVIPVHGFAFIWCVLILLRRSAPYFADALKC